MRFLLFNVATTMALLYMLGNADLKQRVTGWWSDAPRAAEAGPAVGATVDRLAERFDTWAVQFQDQLEQMQLELLRSDPQVAERPAPVGLEPNQVATGNPEAPTTSGGEAETAGVDRTPDPAAPAPDTSTAHAEAAEPKDAAADPPSPAPQEPARKAKETVVAAADPEITGMMLPTDDPAVIRHRAQVLNLEKETAPRPELWMASAEGVEPERPVSAEVRKLLEQAKQAEPADERRDALIDLAHETEQLAIGVAR